MKQNIATRCSFIVLARVVFVLVLHADEVRLQLPPELVADGCGDLIRVPSEPIELCAMQYAEVDNVSVLEIDWQVDATTRVKCDCSTKLLQFVSSSKDFSILTLWRNTAPVPVCIFDNSSCENISLTCPMSSVPGCIVEEFCGEPNGSCAVLYGDFCINLMTSCSDLPSSSPVPTSSDPGSASSLSRLIIFLVVVLFFITILVTFVLFAILLFVFKRNRRKDIKPSIKPLDEADTSLTNQEMVYVKQSPGFFTGHQKEAFLQVAISFSDLRLTGELGEGAFGKVMQGILIQEENGLFNEREVAIKTLKANPSEQELSDLFAESTIMLDFDHPNVMKLLGVCFDSSDNIPLIILPFMANGDLKSFLTKTRRKHSVLSNPADMKLPPGLSYADLVGMCFDVAKGMEYLSSLKFIHRDLAARNCLVGQNLLVKIGDFGLSRDIFGRDYYRLKDHTMLPVKWLPPESLFDNIYNEKTDVWAYAITCWEVFALGQTPYAAINNQDMPQYISVGNRPDQPVLCKNDMFSIISDSWQSDPQDRPCFSKLVKTLLPMYSSLVGNEFVESKVANDLSDRPYFVLETTTMDL